MRAPDIYMALQQCESVRVSTEFESARWRAQCGGGGGGVVGASDASSRALMTQPRSLRPARRQREARSPLSFRSSTISPAMPSVELNTGLFNSRLKLILDAWNVCYLSKRALGASTFLG